MATSSTYIASAPNPCGVRVDAAVLHDQGEVAVRVGEEIDVLGGVALDQEEVGEGARFDDAVRAGVGVSRSAQGDELAVGGGGHGEDLDGRVPAGQLGQRAPLAGGVGGGEED